MPEVADKKLCHETMWAQRLHAVVRGPLSCSLHCAVILNLGDGEEGGAKASTDFRSSKG